MAFTRKSIVPAAFRFLLFSVKPFAQARQKLWLWHKCSTDPCATLSTTLALQWKDKDGVMSNDECLFNSANKFLASAAPLCNSRPAIDLSVLLSKCVLQSCTNNYKALGNDLESTTKRQVEEHFPIVNQPQKRHRRASPGGSTQFSVELILTTPPNSKPGPLFHSLGLPSS